MTAAEHTLDHLAQQLAAAERTLAYSQRHARAAAHENDTAPTPATAVAVVNTERSLVSARAALDLARERHAAQAVLVEQEQILAVQPSATTPHE